MRYKSKRKVALPGVLSGICTLIIVFFFVMGNVSDEENVTTGSKPEIDLTEFTYEGDSYVEVNNNLPFFTEEEKQVVTPFETYSELDSLGRCGVAFANICKELQPTEERGEIGFIKPSGWHTVK